MPKKHREVKGCYKNNGERLIEKSRDKNNMSEEDKNNMSEEDKDNVSKGDKNNMSDEDKNNKFEEKKWKLEEYQKNYQEVKKVSV